MHTARVELKKHTSASTAEAFENERKNLRRIMDEQSDQIAALRKQLEIISGRDDELQEMFLAAAAERDELRNMLAAARQERDDIYKRIEDVYAALYEAGRSGERVETAGYSELVSRIRDAVRTSVSRDATVLVAAKGDDELLKLYGRRAWHFPQTATGVYAGYHPSTSLAAIAHLEILRAKGADYFLLPNTMFWWLDHYADFRRYLETRYSVVFQKDDVCLIFRLHNAVTSNNQSWQARFLDAVALYESCYGEKPSILDWNTGLNLAARFPDLAIFSPGGNEQLLPYIDESVDIIALGFGDSVSLAEGQRVAKSAVMKYGPELEIEWKVDLTSRVELPKTSIVIPWSNNTAEAEACFSAVMTSLPRNFNGEIIVVDGSGGGSGRLQSLADSDLRVRISRNRKAKDFLSACNIGAKTATGESLVFVSTAVLPLAEWLLPLLQILTDRPEAGAVGGKLVYADGSLVQAGGILFSNGSVAGFGHRDVQTDLPPYNYVREVDYCSLALLATRRLVFDQLRGFNAQFGSLDYAAADYGLRIREKGYRVLYQPETAAACVKPVSGADNTSEYEDTERVSRDKLISRWAGALKKQPVRRMQTDECETSLGLRAARSRV